MLNKAFGLAGVRHSFRGNRNPTEALLAAEYFGLKNERMAAESREAASRHGQPSAPLEGPKYRALHTKSDTPVKEHRPLVE